MFCCSCTADNKVQFFNVDMVLIYNGLHQPNRGLLRFRRILSLFCKFCHIPVWLYAFYAIMSCVSPAIASLFRECELQVTLNWFGWVDWCSLSTIQTIIVAIFLQFFSFIHIQGSCKLVVHVMHRRHRSIHCSLHGHGALRLCVSIVLVHSLKSSDNSLLIFA